MAIGKSERYRDTFDFGVQKFGGNGAGWLAGWLGWLGWLAGWLAGLSRMLNFSFDY